MRSIELLAREYPEKTGKELYEMQAKDKELDDLAFQERNKTTLALIKDLNENGGVLQRNFWI